MGKRGRPAKFNGDEDRIIVAKPDRETWDEYAAKVNAVRGKRHTGLQCRTRHSELKKKAKRALAAAGVEAEPPAAAPTPSGVTGCGVEQLETAAARGVALAGDIIANAAARPPKSLSHAVSLIAACGPVVRYAAERRTKNALAGSGPPRTIEEAMYRLGMTGDSWAAWITVARLIDGSELSHEDIRIIRERTGGDPPEGAVNEFWAVVGRRGGKSQFSGVCAVTWASRSYPRATAPEVAVVARTLQQGRVVADYARSAAERLGVAGSGGSRLVIPIKDGATIRVQPNTSSVRGPTVVAAVLDEVAHYHTGVDAAWSDEDLLTALTPALATVRRPLLMGISSPWRRRGVLADRWKSWQAGERTPGRVVWHGPTRTMNPTITAARIEQEIAANPSLASEFSAEFFADGGAWLPPHVLADDVVKAMPVGPVPVKRGAKLHAYVDAASGGGEDSMALAVAETLEAEMVVDWSIGEYREDEYRRRARLVEVMEIQPDFDPEEAVARMASVLKKYGLKTVTGDRWASGMQDVVWRRAGITYFVGERTASEIYHAALPALLSGRIDLVNDPVLIEQLRELIEDGGQDPPPKITHPKNGHDDVANASCGALVEALAGPGVEVG